MTPHTESWETATMNADHHYDAGCEEFSSSRRGFLKGLVGAAGAGVLTAVAGDVFTQTAFAATGKADSVLVVLSMRGGADGLSLVVPHGDDAYYAARPRIAVPASRLLAKDATFGLHPSLKPLLPMWNAGRLAAVHATGLSAPNRSHFAAMEQIEDADPGSSARRGWINRMIGLDSFGSPLQAVQLGEPITPAQLYGREPTLVTRKVGDVSFPNAANRTTYRQRISAMHTMWDREPGPLGRGVRATARAVRDFKPVHGTSTKPRNGAAYPKNDLGSSLADTARLLRADVGVEVVTVDFGSWDMHANVGTLERGEMKDMANEMALAVAAFFTDLGALASKVTLVTVSEFGRRVKENANLGLDHGYGNVMFLAGAGVRGGRYYGQWPGLGSTKLVDGDLAVTTDYRSVLREVLRSRFDVDTSKVFPRFSAERVGVMAGQ
jgi:uncharacterized protein (DUF1501 family)